jgi:hypothetical protein
MFDIPLPPVHIAARDCHPAPRDAKIRFGLADAETVLQYQDLKFNVRLPRVVQALAENRLIRAPWR